MDSSDKGIAGDVILYQEVISGQFILNPSQKLDLAKYSS
jgi:hypothetical protein